MRRLTNRESEMTDNTELDKSMKEFSDRINGLRKEVSQTFEELREADDSFNKALKQADDNFYKAYREAFTPEALLTIMNGESHDIGNANFTEK